MLFPEFPALNAALEKVCESRILSKLISCADVSKFPPFSVMGRLKVRRVLNVDIEDGSVLVLDIRPALSLSPVSIADFR